MDSRVPVSPLEYNEQNLVKAIPGEILVNYEQAKIYVKSKVYPFEVKEITKEIIDNMTYMNADNLRLSLNKLELENDIENDDLISVLLEIIRRTDTNVNIEPIDSFTRISGAEIKADNKSVILKNKKLQIGNYDVASDGSVLIKTSTGVRWSSPNLIKDSENSDEELTPENPIDGLGGTILEVPVDSGVIHLSPSLKQMTTNIRSSAFVNLPNTVDKYAKIEWCLSTSNYIPVLHFDDNVIWKYGQSLDGHKPIDNAFIIYNFQTWDYGAHWLAERTLYSETYNYNGIIDEDYLNENYYKKPEIDEKLSWIRK